jgi:hypothetical protein
MDKDHIKTDLQALGFYKHGFSPFATFAFAFNKYGCFLFANLGLL